MRRAGPQDATAPDAILARHQATSMFLRSYLAAHGTRDDAHLNGTTFFVPACGINTRLPDTVRIGGVFTADVLRGNDYARRAAVGVSLRCVREGAARSALFANNEAAAHAHAALGYSREGDCRVALLRAPLRIGDTR